MATKRDVPTVERLAYWKQRCHHAEYRIEWAEESMEHNRAWMSRCHDEERRLRDRCGFLYAVAMAHGATREELTGP